MMEWHCSLCANDSCEKYKNISKEPRECYISQTNTHILDDKEMRDITFDKPYYSAPEWNALLICPLLFTLIFVLPGIFCIYIPILSDISDKKINEEGLIINKYKILIHSVIENMYTPFLLGWFVCKHVSFTIYSGNIEIEILASFFFWIISLSIYIVDVTMSIISICNGHYWVSPRIPLLGFYTRFRMNKIELIKYNMYITSLQPLRIIIEYVPQLIILSVFISKHKDVVGPLEIACLIIPTIYILRYLLQLVDYMHPKPISKPNKKDVPKENIIIAIAPDPPSYSPKHDEFIF